MEAEADLMEIGNWRNKEAFIPWTGAGRAVPRVISKMAIAANEAIAHRPSGMAICVSVGPSERLSVVITHDKSVTITRGMRFVAWNGVVPSRAAEWVGLEIVCHRQTS